MAHGVRSRREFLAGVAGAAGSAAALATSGVRADRAWAAQLEQLGSTTAATSITPLVLSSDLYASPDPQRFVFAISKGKGVKFASGAPARIALTPPGARTAAMLDATLHAEGLPKHRGIYRVDQRFTTPGNWKGIVESGGRRVKFFVSVKEAAEAPTAGSPAPRAQSPTPTATLGVDPICTRTPACPLHDVSLADVIGHGRPVVAIFATPALCQSEYCGPVLDEVLDLVAGYRDRITFVHVDIYTSLDAQKRKVAPTVLAWGLPSEPWIFTIDAGGTIRNRLDGAIAKDEITAVLDGLSTPA